jgi:hypothetical protein
MLVLRQYELISYGSFVEWLQVSDQIVQMIELNCIQHFTTLQKAAARIGEILLHVAIGRFVSIILPDKVFAGVDATGFQDGHAASYYMYSCSLRQLYTKLSAGSDMTTQPVIAVVIEHHAISHDIRHFTQILEWITSVTRPWIFVLDHGV